MFVPNATCKLHAITKRRDVRGTPVYLPPVRVRCAVVKTAEKLMKSSVRADATSSRGRIDEEQGETRILFPKSADVRLGDVVVIDGFTLEIVQVFPRRNVLGIVDHLDCRLDPRTEMP